MKKVFVLSELTKMHPVEQIIKDCDEAIVSEDFDFLMKNYTDDAVLVVQPGINAVGKTQIRKAFERIAVYFQHGLVVEQAGMHILETSSTALVLARTIIKVPNQPPEERKATYVFNKINGCWLCSVDNSYGHQLLEKNA